MESRNLGLGRALGWERTPDGVEFRCATELLAPARVAVEVAGPRAVRVRITAGAVAVAKAFTYVTERPERGPWTLETPEGRVVLRTAHLTVEATLDPWQLAFRTADGRLLTHEVQDDVNFAGQRLGPRPGLQVETLPHDPARRALAVVDNLLLDPEDHFFGGGEKFTRLDHVGRSIRIWNRNPYGARSETAYKNIPLLVGSRGYGLFVDVPTAVTFHLGSRSNRTFTIEAAGPELDYYVLAGTPKEIVGVYTDMTGKPPVPPEWAFGLWASTCFVKFTEASVLETARRLRQEGIPCDVFHLDSFWQRAFMWCDFEWDAERLPDPRAAHGRPAPGRLPQLPVDQPLRLAARARSIRKASPAATSCAAPTAASTTLSCGASARSGAWGSAPSSTSPAPRPSAGTGGCWTASWRSAPTPSSRTSPRRSRRTPASRTGSAGAEMHNPYPLLFQRESFEATQAARGPRAVAWSRSAAPGVQRYPGHWAGDSECTFLDMANTLRGGLASAMSGLAYWSHDIGGFWGEPSPELYVRWAQLGFLSALSRYHGATPRDPWLFGEEALAIFREYARLRSQLVPYLVSHGWEATDDGRAPHAPDGHGVPGRPGRLRLRPPVLPRTGAPRVARHQRGRHRHHVPAAGALDGLVERDGPRRVRGRCAARCRSGSCRSTSARTVSSCSGPVRNHVAEATGRPAHGGGLRDDGGGLRSPHRRRIGRAPRPARRPAGDAERRRGGRRDAGSARLAPARCRGADPGGRRGPRPAPPGTGGAGRRRPRLDGRGSHR